MLPTKLAVVTRAPVVSVGGGFPPPPPPPASILFRFSRPPVTVLPAREAIGSTDPSSFWITCWAVAVGFLSQYTASAPATCGVAMLVPLNELYVLFRVVLRMDTPGAPRSTVFAP